MERSGGKEGRSGVVAGRFERISPMMGSEEAVIKLSASSCDCAERLQKLWESASTPPI